MTLSVELLTETPVSTAVCIDGNIYVNVWTSAPTLEQLRVVVDGEHQMRRGYRSLDIIERTDQLAFAPGVRQAFQTYGKEVAGNVRVNIVVIRAGGFAGAVIHGLVGLLNMVGLSTTIAPSLEYGLSLLLQDADVAAEDVQPLLLAQIARHKARVPPPGR